MWKEIKYEEEFFGENCAGASRDWMECNLHHVWPREGRLQWEHPQGFFWILCHWKTETENHTPAQESKGMQVPPVDQMWAMLSPPQGNSGRRARASQGDSCGSGHTDSSTPSQRLLSYLHLPNFGGLSNSSLQRSGEVGEGKADANSPLRQTSANHRPLQERSLTLSDVLILTFYSVFLVLCCLGTLQTLEGLSLPGLVNS